MISSQLLNIFQIGFFSKILTLSKFIFLLFRHFLKVLIRGAWSRLFPSLAFSFSSNMIFS